MIKIHSNLPRNCELELGKACEFFLNPKKNVEVKAYLQHGSILYLVPVFDWTRTTKFSLFPEAPGNYVLHVAWRDSEDRQGWKEYPFSVSAGAPLDHAPQLVKVSEEIQPWVTNQWEAMVFSAYEKPIIDYLIRIVKKGWVVYDVGANLGLYSILLSKLAGNRGFVYGFEANPVCINFLESNLALNQVDNCKILPIALLEKESVAEFSINYGSTGIGITADYSFFSSKVGHHIGVQSSSVDRLRETFPIKKPDFIKIDIEGAEVSAIQGMKSTLQEFLPVILLEAHRKNAAQGTLPFLNSLGYQFYDPIAGESFSDADEFLAAFTDRVIQLFCLPPKSGWRSLLPAWF